MPWQSRAVPQQLNMMSLYSRADLGQCPHLPDLGIWKSSILLPNTKFIFYFLLNLLSMASFKLLFKVLSVSTAPFPQDPVRNAGQTLSPTCDVSQKESQHSNETVELLHVEFEQLCGEPHLLF